MCYGLFVVAVGSAIVLPLIQALKAPKEIVKSGLGVLVLVVIFGISYALSGDEVTPKYAALGIDANASRMVGAGLITFYIIFALSFVGVIYSEINKALK